MIHKLYISSQDHLRFTKTCDICDIKIPIEKSEFLYLEGLGIEVCMQCLGEEKAFTKWIVDNHTWRSDWDDANHDDLSKPELVFSSKIIRYTYMNFGIHQLDLTHSTLIKFDKNGMEFKKPC